MGEDPRIQNWEGPHERGSTLFTWARIHTSRGSIHWEDSHIERIHTCNYYPTLSTYPIFIPTHPPHPQKHHLSRHSKMILTSKIAHWPHDSLFLAPSRANFLYTWWVYTPCMFIKILSDIPKLAIAMDNSEDSTLSDCQMKDIAQTFCGAGVLTQTVGNTNKQFGVYAVQLWAFKILMNNANNKSRTPADCDVNSEYYAGPQKFNFRTGCMHNAECIYRHMLNTQASAFHLLSRGFPFQANLPPLWCNATKTSWVGCQVQSRTSCILCS